MVMHIKEKLDRVQQCPVDLKTKAWHSKHVCLSLCFNLVNCLLKVVQSLMQAWNFRNFRDKATLLAAGQFF